MSASPIDLILSVVEKPRRRQSGQYSARCPAHDDRSPSLSIRETSDGAVLLHCFAGCAVSDVVAALCLQMHDLFPPRERPMGAPKRVASALTALQALELLDQEASLVAMAAANLAHGHAVGEGDRQRLMLAAGRVAAIRREVSHA
jgi:hypothetical protein